MGAVTGITGVERFGVDTLVWEGTRLIVRSPREMPAWRVGRHRRTAVHFRGRRYAVVATHAEVGKHEYTLELWPERAHELPAREIRYDEAYVRDREDEARMRETMRRQSFGLVPLWPVLGFLPSKWKLVLHRRFGVESMAATRRSVLLEAFGILATFVPAVISLGGGLGERGLPWIGTFVVLLVDFLVRCSVLFEDDYPRFGFYEWLVHRDLVRVVVHGWSVMTARLTRGRRR